MAFVTINSENIEVQKPITTDLLTKIKDNEDDLNSRVNDLEASAGKVKVFHEDIFNIYDTPILDNLMTFQAIAPFRLTDAVIGVYDLAGTETGILSFQVKKSSTRDFSAATSVFTTQPSLNIATCGDYATSSNAVFDSSYQEIEIGDCLQLSVDSFGDTNLYKIYIRLSGEPS